MERGVRRGLVRRAAPWLAVLGAASLAIGGESLLFSSHKPGEAVGTPFRVITLPKIAVNRFAFVDDGGTTVLKVESNNSAGSIAVPLATTREQGTVLHWRWKVDRVLERADLDLKTGDDFSARVYVFFDVPLASLSFLERSKIRLARLVAGEDVPTAALCYVWDNKHRVGHTAWSPYSTRVRKTVLQSGPEAVGAWREEARDVAADFKAAFGIEMPAVTAVAVGNDTDNTDDHAVAWFGDLRFSK